MEANTRIDHFTVAINLDRILMGVNSLIGRGNWITGFPSETTSQHFQHQLGRRSELRLGESVAITKNHHFDCTSCIDIGPFSTIGGYQSQFLTHSINLEDCRQDSAPIRIGAYSFVSTNVVVLGGAVLPAYSILGAKALLNKAYAEEWTMYGGVPARPLKPVSRDAKYFVRESGFVH